MPQIISLSQFATHLARGEVAPLYALVGEEDLLRDSALFQLKQAVLGTDGDDINCNVFYGDESEGAQIVSCASEVAVFGARRLVIVKAAESLPARQSESLFPYLKEPSDSSTVVFVASKLDGRLKFTQALMHASVVVDCAPLKEAQLLPWLKDEARRAGVRIDDEALQMLKEVSGESLYSVRRELEKLASFVPAERSVTVKDVSTLRGTEPGVSVFDLTAAIGAKNRARALGIVARNLEAGEAPLRILGSLAWQYRRLWKVKELIRQRGREQEASRILRMDPHRIRTFLSQFTEAHLRAAMQACHELDGNLKGGSAGRPSILLDRLILKLCQAVQTDGFTATPGTPISGAASKARSFSNVRTVSATRPRN